MHLQNISFKYVEKAEGEMMKHSIEFETISLDRYFLTCKKISVVLEQR